MTINISEPIYYTRMNRNINGNAIQIVYFYDNHHITTSQKCDNETIKIDDLIIKILKKNTNTELILEDYYNIDLHKLEEEQKVQNEKSYIQKMKDKFRKKFKDNSQIFFADIRIPKLCEYPMTFLLSNYIADTQYNDLKKKNRRRQ